MKNIVWCCLILLFFLSCITEADLKPFDYSLGRKKQEELKRLYFTDVDLKSDPQAFQAFLIGKRDAVSAAWWGFDRDDATSALRSALTSGAKVIIIPDMGKPWYSETLSLRSNTTIILEEGVELIAKRGAFKSLAAFLLSLKDVENITILGYGASLRMWKEDYTKAPYQKSEWRHALALYGTSHVLIAGLTIERSGGDGIYLGRGQRGRNYDLELQDLIIKDNYRQAISVISAEKLHIANCLLANTSGTAPAAGIDFEPNHPDEVLQDCRLTNCIMRGNSGAGFLAALHNLAFESQPIAITLEDCFIYANSFSICIFGAQHGVQGKITFIDCKINGLFLAPGVPEARLKITFN